MLDWNSITGKKVLVIHVRGEYTPQVETGVVIGCDPNIGICIADVGKSKPWFISHGRLSPKRKGLRYNKKQDKILQLIFSQLQSGYFSIGEVEKAIKKLKRSYGFGSGNGANCPFSQ